MGAPVQEDSDIEALTVGEVRKLAVAPGHQTNLLATGVEYA